MVTKKASKKTKRVSTLELQDRTVANKFSISSLRKKVGILTDTAMTAQEDIKEIRAKGDRTSFWLKVLWFVIILDTVARSIQPM